MTFTVTNAEDITTGKNVWNCINCEKVKVVSGERMHWSTSTIELSIMQINVDRGREASSIARVTADELSVDVVLM